MISRYGGLISLGLVFTALRFLIGSGSNTLLILSASFRILLWSLKQDDVRGYLTLISLLTVFALWPRKKRPAKRTSLETTSILTPGPLRPLIIPCRTTHTRIFPEKNSFGYSYLQVGIPVGWKGSVSSILGADEDSGRKSWFSVNAGDYLARGHENLGLEGKLAEYLLSQGEQLQEYAHGYFLTAPRHLGYAFNPVSFWYLFSKNMILQAIILEVNNTFDERRLYFMKRGLDFDGNAADQDIKFTNSWPKDFHVSPFNSRKGDYSLAAVNPFTSTNKSELKIDNVITLKSSKGHAKLVARIFSTGPPIDPYTLSTWTTIKLISSWFWIGLVTYPRICKEAAKLFFHRKLHVWYRPEVTKTSIGRNPTAREQIIASTFLLSLQHQLNFSKKISSIEYTPPNGSHVDIKILQPKKSTDIDKTSQLLTLQILSPQFFTDLATTHSQESYILTSEKTPAEARVFITSSFTLLANLLAQVPSSLPEKPNVSASRCERLRMRILAAIQRSTNQVKGLDGFVMRMPDQNERRVYLEAVTGLVLADRVTGGLDGLLDTVRDGLGAVLAWMITGVTFEMIDTM